MKDFKKSSLELGLLLNSLISRDRSLEYWRRGPVPMGSKYPGNELMRLGSEDKFEPPLGMSGRFCRLCCEPCEPFMPPPPYEPGVKETGGNMLPGPPAYETCPP